MDVERKLVPFDERSTLWEAVKEGALTSAEVSPSGHFRPAAEAPRRERPIPEMRVCTTPERVRRRGHATVKDRADAASQTTGDENACPDCADTQALQRRVKVLERRAQRAELVLAQLVKFDSRYHHE